MRQTIQCESRRLRGCAVVALLAMVIGAAVAHAQTNPLPTGQYEVVRSSGVHDNPTKEFQMVYQTVIHTDDETPWVRLQFADAHLDGASYLRLTSLLDGAVQHLHAEHLLDWQMSSAYFNGRSVRIELFAAPGTMGNFVEINEVLVGLRSDGPRISSQCGAADDRVLSDEPSAGRLVPVGCTATIYNEASCAITAGHCLGSADVWEFNVPMSLPDGTIVHPGPEDQYAVDPASRIGTAAGVGNDWGHFTCFANTETGQLPFETQGALTPLATEIPPLPMDIQIFGYGLDFDDRDRSQ
ncbi:MAG: hypothetical protein IID39_10320, partial [Planctomycetes bacterium]|nr:hypothetical protein [Planctomycetota bacterium]